jgi:hypothetical protein
MTPQEKSDIVLRWLAFSPFALGNVTFYEIYDGIIRQHPEFNNDYWAGELSKILADLVKKEQVEAWETITDVYTPEQEGPTQKKQKKFATTLIGQVAAYDLLPQKK